MKFEKIKYNELNARQKESYNFHKKAAKLAEYGFTSIRLSDDWMGADFIAIHADGEIDLKIQLKSRLTFSKKYLGKNLYICFPNNGHWYLYPHDEALEKVIASGQLIGTESWDIRGGYSWKYVTERNQKLLENYLLD